MEDTVQTEETLETTEEIPAEEVEETTEETPEETVEKPKKPEIGDEDYTQSVKRQMTKLRMRARDAEERAAKAEAQVREQGKQRPKRPSMDAYTDQYGNIDHRYYSAMEKYEDSVLDWRESQKEVKQNEAMRVAKEEERIAEFINKAEPMIEKYPDFYDVVDKPVFSRALTDELLEHENGPSIAYFLGKNEALAANIGKMSPKKMDQELGKLEERLSTLAIKPSNAPAPINPVHDSKGELPKDIDDIEDDQEWYNAYKRERLRKFRGG